MAPRLYHISENPNLTVMTPRVPQNRLVSKGYENGTIGRVCFAPTIADCISAAPRGKAGEVLYVYLAQGVNPEYVYKPTINDVPDSKYTHEIWYLKPVNVKRVGVIVVGDAYLEQRFLGPKSFEKHFTLRWHNYKRFNKNGPTEEEKLEFLKTQPVYQSMLRKQEEERAEKEKMKKIGKTAAIVSAALASGLAVFSLVGNRLKPINK
jgi:hypothetical protein